MVFKYYAAITAFVLGTVAGQAQNLERPPESPQSHGFVGQLVPFLGGKCPEFATVLADGGQLSAPQYPELFAVLGQTYGPMNGDNFQLPDMRGAVALGDGPQFKVGQRVDVPIASNASPISAVAITWCVVTR